MIRFLLPIFLLLAAFPLAAQGCYENLQNGAGVSTDPSRASGAACKLRESLPEANRASFATYSASLYRFAGNFAPGAAEALVTRLEARAAAASPYYLLIVWEASEDNLFATPHVRVNLPADGPFACLNPLRRSAWQARLLLQAQGDAPRAKDPEEYLRAETRLMEELMGYVKDLIKCCQEGQTCPDCITRKERIALLKAYPFRTIGQTSYNPATLKYRVDNVEIPGNSTAQIRDGIGISLDLGGGPVNIAEKLKELALEKPELGLNALIVHDSLLCDPELLPGKFFGGPGLRAAGSQVYVILQRDGNVDVLGDEQGKEEIFKALTKGKRFLKVLRSQKQINPCFYQNRLEIGAKNLYITPTGKVINFQNTEEIVGGETASIPSLIRAPGYSVGHPHMKDGCLIDFVLNNEKYISILEGDDYFWGYIKEDFFIETYKKLANLGVAGTLTDDAGNSLENVVGVKDLINEANAYKEPNQYLAESYFYNPSVADKVLTHIVDNGIVISYEVIPPLNKPYTGTFFTENLERTQIACKTCDKGPGIEFYEEYYKKESTSPADAQQLCLIAQLINKLAKLYFEGDLPSEKAGNVKWNNADLQRVYGDLFNQLRKNGFSWADIAGELGSAVEWNYKEFKNLSRADLLRLSLAAKSDRAITEISPAWRYQLLVDIANGKFKGGGSTTVTNIHGAKFNSTSAESLVIRLFKYIRPDYIVPFFDKISNDASLVNKLFIGFNDFEIYFVGDNNYKTFFEVFLSLYKKAKNINASNEAELIQKLESSGHVYRLGDVVFTNVLVPASEGATFPKIGNLYCEIIPVNAEIYSSAEIKGVALSAEIAYPDLDFAGFNECGVKKESVNVGLFEPIGIVFSKVVNGGSTVEYTSIQVYPAFALKFWADLTRRKKEEEAINIIINTALLPLGAAEIQAARGIHQALAFIQTIGTAGDIGFAAWDLNSGAWESEKDFQTFRDTWHLLIGLSSAPSIYNAVKASGASLVTILSGISQKVKNGVKEGGRALLAELRQIFNIADGASALSRLTARFAMFVDITTAKNLAKQIEAVISNPPDPSKAIFETEISDDFLKLYAQASDGEASRSILKPILNNREKTFAFQDDLKDASFFNMIKENPKLYKPWEVLFKGGKLIRTNQDNLNFLVRVISRISSKSGDIEWDALNKTLSELDKESTNAFLENLKLADSEFDNNDLWRFEVTRSLPNKIDIFIKGIVQEVINFKNRTLYGPSDVSTYAEFQRKSTELLMPYVSNGSGKRLIIGKNNSTVAVGEYFETLPGVLDIHIHGQFFEEYGKYYYGAFIGDGSVKAENRILFDYNYLIAIIRTNPDYNSASAIRLFACWGDQCGAAEIANALNKPVLAADEFIYTVDDPSSPYPLGSMRMINGTIKLIVPE